ncbi:tetratricopeptide repeat protein [Sphingorhabdus sp. SMR4y]|uniref:tetratricopeptide repeat protein n=1 Tax=Sphingorhabdus sp. SMR4y TaxID=2584094 RepID=UPI000B5C743F|nr:tetratricopeptide repeat protein [Sphingorhabdus sp. SMR4y]ASK88418.1 tetratricopeptide repeat protein [Sphingorhabdus sp. SMR4y]
MRGLISYFVLGLVMLIPGSLRATVLAERDQSGRGAIIEAAIDGGRLIQASEMLHQMRKHSLDSERAELKILEAELAIAKKDDRHAIKLFARYLQSPEYLCRAKEGSGIAIARSGDWDIAIGLLADVTIKCPDRWKAWNMMGIALAHFGKYQASRYAFDKALSLSDTSPVVLNNLGYSLLARQNYVEAVGIFEMAVIQQPENKRFQNNLDIARAAMGEAPRRATKESQSRWVERLTNSGYAALLAGHKQAGTALLSNAVIGSSSMASKAAANLSWTATHGTKP